MSSLNVGEPIRQPRPGLGPSIPTLASKTGFSPSLISQVEHGQVTPSIGSLERIALALGVSPGKFFAEPAGSATALVRSTIRQKLISSWSPVSIEGLGPLDGSWKLEPIMIVMAPRGRSGQYPTVCAAEKFASTLEGEAALVLGDGVHVLRNGHALTFASANPHQWENAGAGPAQILIVALHSEH